MEYVGNTKTRGKEEERRTAERKTQKNNQGNQEPDTLTICNHLRDKIKRK